MLRPTISRRLFSAGLAAGAAALTLRGSRALLALDLAEGSEAETLRALAAGVTTWLERETKPGDFATGSRRFSGEWAFGTLMMAAMGLGQMALQSPTDRPAVASVMERLVDRMLEPSMASFSREAWGTDPLKALDGHAAYLGYLNLAVGLVRSIAPETRHRPLGIDLTEAARVRVARSPRGFVETYPGEAYPVDNAALLASLHHGDLLANAGRSVELERGLAALRQSVDASSGLLLQSVCNDTLAPRDAARGSGTCLAIYFLRAAHPGLSSDLWSAVKERLLGQVLGFRAVREYPRGVSSRGDIDSGPVLMGFGVSASGFALGAARIHGDVEIRRDLYATASLFGAPTRVGGSSAEPRALHFVTGGPLGDALLLAMLTAPTGTQGGFSTGASA